LAVVEYTERGQLRDLRCADKPLLENEADEARLCGFGQSGKPAIALLYGDKGELRGRLSHLEGARTGAESYWDNGKLRSQEEGSKDGRQIERSFFQDGTKRLEVVWQKADRGRVKEYEQEFHDSGNIVRENRWQAGDLVSEKTFYLNGQPRVETLYRKRDGMPVIEVKEFHDNGKPASNGSYTMANRNSRLPDGEHRKYDVEGRLRQVRSHDAKGRLMRVQEIDESGRTTRDDEVFEDGSRKMK
jgi:antitoxin component YwqK of YwqJK toxin-antitoxin module